MTDNLDVDVLIVGGGPAGLSTALHLQRIAPDLTPRILVLEKAHYPRPKLCAGGLVTDAEILLQGLGLDVSEIPHVDADAAHFDFRGHGLTVSVPKTHTLRIIRRDEFDAWLAGKARDRGIAICDGITVEAVKPGSDGVTVETSDGIFRVKVVVGADGSNGVTRRCILPGDSVSKARVLEILLPSVGQMTSSRHKEKQAYFDFSPMPKSVAGYTWDFPTQVKGQSMRCWGIYDANLFPGSKRPPLKELLAAEMMRCGYDLDDRALQGAPICWFDPLSRISIPRVLLAGDAAGADPLFGEGISIALGYGKVAAKELSQAFSRGDFSFTGYRPRVILSPLGGALLARLILVHLLTFFRWTWFQFLLWRVLKPFVILVAWLFVLNWGRKLR